MKKIVVLFILGLAVLLASVCDASAEMIDVVHLKNGSVIRGMIIEIISNETIKIETADGSVFVYQFDEIEQITKEMGGVEKMFLQKILPFLNRFLPFFSWEWKDLFWSAFFIFLIYTSAGAF